MKKSLSLFAILFVAMLFTQCKKDSVTPSTPTTSAAFSGTWRVRSFIKDNVDITAQFDSCVFMCNNDGSMTIQNNGNSYSCSWNYPETDHSICHFHISGCDESSALWECEDDWVLTSHDAQNCVFTSQNPHHNNTMCWTKL